MLVFKKYGFQTKIKSNLNEEGVFFSSDRRFTFPGLEFTSKYARQNMFTKRRIMKYYSKIFISNTYKDWNILKQIEI
jgi:hypothetical protein